MTSTEVLTDSFCYQLVFRFYHYIMVSIDSYYIIERHKVIS